MTAFFRFPDGRKTIRQTFLAALGGGGGGVVEGVGVEGGGGGWGGGKNTTTPSFQVPNSGTDVLISPGREDQVVLLRLRSGQSRLNLYPHGHQNEPSSPLTPCAPVAYKTSQRTTSCREPVWPSGKALGW